jgi:hypothetical protein
LKLYLQDDGAAVLQELLNLLFNGAIEVTRVLGPLEEAALLNPLLELLP